MKNIFIKAFKNWISRDPFTQAAAAAYYAIFSFPGLLIILIGLGALFFDIESVERHVLSYIGNIIGAESARNVRAIIHETQVNNHDVLALIVGALTLMFGATGLFVQLQRSLNHIWEVEVKKSAPFSEFFMNRLASLGMIFAIGFVLLVSLMITTALTIFSEWLERHVPDMLVWVMAFFNVFLSLATVGLLFTLIFKILPDAQISWQSASFGGIASSVLFNAGEYALTSYFTIAEPQSTFGAAGSIIMLMIWVSYSCIILFFGAELSKAYGEEIHNGKAPPTPIAKRKT